MLTETETHLDKAVPMARNQDFRDHRAFIPVVPEDHQGPLQPAPVFSTNPFLPTLVKNLLGGGCCDDLTKSEVATGASFEGCRRNLDP